MNPAHASAAPVRLGDFELIDHVAQAPLVRGVEGAPMLELFAREVRRADGGDGLPWLVYLQGGPGFESPRPDDDRGWLGAATRRFRVLLVDQRGTGRSTAIESGPPVPTLRVLTAHRADAIVADCELWRGLLANDAPWAVLGQSFGGFCAVHYLSHHPAALERALVAGGLPPFVPIEEVYARTFARMRQRSLDHYETFEGDAEIVDRVAQALSTGDVFLPCGDRLSIPRFQQVGMALGRARGGAALHWLLESAFAHGGSRPSQRFLHAVERSQGYPTNPLYAVLHESIYVEGRASAWAADRVRRASGEHEWVPTRPLTLTGESVHPWMFSEYAALRPFADVADEVARHESWPALYHRERLATNEVPVAAAVYTNDLFVDRELSLATARAIANTSVFESSRHEHDGLRDDGAAVFGELLGRTDRALARAVDAR